ncbi:MAG: polysaccharide biosynthesis/export family protein [Gemmatimonadaceae bacterium]|nr:polysaccharide biosynthesis/export family protein [Gemmatimonadaceae bacterium]
MRRLLLLALFAIGPALPAQAAASPEFALRPGDVLQLFHWRDSLLRGDFPIEVDGSVVLPLLGRRSVTGRPWSSVRDSLGAAYARELRAPDLRITPLRRVFVLGFVRQPGILLADPNTTIAGAIAMAGGASADGDLRRVRVRRDGAVLAERVSVESDLVRADVRSGDEVFVDRRGWFDRNSAFMVSAIVGLAGIVVTLIVAR